MAVVVLLEAEVVVAAARVESVVAAVWVALEAELALELEAVVDPELVGVKSEIEEGDDATELINMQCPAF